VKVGTPSNLLEEFVAVLPELAPAVQEKVKDMTLALLNGVK